MFKILKYNTEDSVDVEYDIKRNCSYHGCDIICRCGEIVNPRIEKINASVNNFDFKKGSSYQTAKDLSKIDHYVLKRLMLIHGAYNESYYEFDIRGGYYGQECFGCTFDNNATLIEDSEIVLNLNSDIEKIKFVLIKEYAYIAPMIEDAENAEIISIKLSDIHHSSGMSMLKRQTDYVYDFENNDTAYGIIYKNKIVDGNHRFSNLCAVHGTNTDKTFPYIRLS